MEQTKADLWTLKPNPTVTSFFKLSLTDGHSPALGKAPVYTGRCGLGWAFIFYATNGDVAKPIWGGAVIDKHTLFKISLAPDHRIVSANLDKVLITVEAYKDTSKKDIHASKISLSGTRVITLVSILSVANFTGDISIEIHVELPTTFDLVADPSRSEQKLRRSLARSLIGDELGDVKFALFSRRGDNDVTDLELVVANSSLLHGYSTFLDDLLSEANKEREVITVADLASPIYNAYDYMSDSDLESELDFDGNEDLGSQSSTSGTLTNDQHQKKDQPGHSTRRKLDDQEPVILVRDTAFATWKALMFYLYTREIHFKPLTSGSPVSNAEADDFSVGCSPKSMYRLATKIGSEELRMLSLKAIIHGISKDNVVKELLSHFTSMYPEVQEAEVGVLIPLLKEPTVVKELIYNMESVTIRGPPYCGAIVAAIVNRLVKLVIEERPCSTCLLAKENEDKTPHDKIDDDEDTNSPEDDDHDEDKKKNNRNAGNSRKPKDGSKDEKHSEGDRNSFNKSKPSKSDRNKPKPGEPTYQPEPTGISRKENPDPSDPEDPYNDMDGFAGGWGKKSLKKGSRFGALGENGGF